MYSIGARQRMSEKLQRLWATKNKNDEWWSSFVTSPLAILVNLLVVDFRWLSPNVITLFSFVVAIAAACLIVVGNQVNFYIAAALIHLSHILDCMDGQMARYRGVSSRSGSFFDKITDQSQVVLWFGAIGYAAYFQSDYILPLLLAFAGVAFYFLRGYIKYVAVFIEVSDNAGYLEKSAREVSEIDEGRAEMAGLGHGLLANLKWLLREQPKALCFDEGVFIFMLSVALIFNVLIPVLWVFALSQVTYGVYRSFQRGFQLHRNRLPQVFTTTEK